MPLTQEQIRLMAKNLKNCSKRTIKDVLDFLEGDEERKDLIKELKKVLDFDPEVL